MSTTTNGKHTSGRITERSLTIVSERRYEGTRELQTYDADRVPQVVGAAAAAMFFLLLLIQTPFLPLYFSESERDELDKLKQERSQNGK